VAACFVLWVLPLAAPKIPPVPSDKKLKKMVKEALERGREYLKFVLYLERDEEFSKRYKALKTRLSRLSINRYRAERGQKLQEPAITKPRKRKVHPDRRIEELMRELDGIERRAYELERALVAGKKVSVNDTASLSRRLSGIAGEIARREAPLIGLALLRAGEPHDSPDIKTLIEKTKAYVSAHSRTQTGPRFSYDYTAPLILMFWEELLARRGMGEGLSYRQAVRRQAALLPEEEKKLLNTVVKGLINGAAYNATRQKVPQKFWLWGATDNSCTQFVMMGLRCAVNMGLEVPKDLIEQSATAVLSSQQEKGERVKWFFVPFAELSYEDLKKIEEKKGIDRMLEQSGTRRFRTRAEWGIKRRRYRREGKMLARGFPYNVRPPTRKRASSIPPRLSTTVGGVCSLAIAKALLARKKALRKKLEARLNQAIRDGCGFIATKFDELLELQKKDGRYLPPRGSWYFYTWWALERACAMTLLERLDGRDWWRIGATVIVHLQKKDGSWAHYQQTYEQSTIATAFAMLFLSRGTLPVVGEPRGETVPTGKSMFNRKKEQKPKKEQKR